MPIVRRLQFLLPLLTISLSQQTVAQQPVGIPALPEQPPFELTVRPVSLGVPQTPADTQTVFQIDPEGRLSLEFELTWSGDEPVTIYWGNLNYGNWVRLTIKTPLEKELVTSYNAPELRPDRASDRNIVTLQPGESVTGRFGVGSGSAETQMFRFREPGPWELTASVAIHVAGGDPAQPDSWQSLGRVTAAPIPFMVTLDEKTVIETRLVRGQVTDSDGAPVPRADVYVHVESTNQWSSYSPGARFIPYARAVTDEEGRFEFPSIPAGEPRLMLGVVHQSLPPTDKTVAVDPATDVLDVDFQLSPGRIVTGTVVDTEGRPLSEVFLSRPFVPWTRFPDAAITDTDGRFEIHGVPTGEAWIPARKRGDWEVVDESNALAAGAGPTSTTIVMKPRQSPGELTGIARFENGEPAGNMDLTMWIDRPDGDPRESRGETDRDGRYSIELTSEQANAAGPISGLVELARPLAETTSDRPMTRFDVPPGERDIDLVFRREHSLTINLTSVVPLPVDLNVRVRVSARPSHGSRLISTRTLRGSHLSPRTLHDLTPGRYRVNVALQEASHHNWSEDVIIPFDEPTTDHEISFEIPEIHFGTLHVEVRYPDGRKPADRTSVWMDANGAHGWRHIYNGVATFQVVPVGRVTVTHNERNGVVGLPIQGRIEADRETTLGPLVLQTVEEAYGHVAGRVLMADGTPALGAAVALQNSVSSHSGSFGDHNRIDGAGRFQSSAQPGTDLLVISLRGCDLWPPGSAAETATQTSPFGSKYFETQALTRSLVRPVTLTGGQEQEVDVSLPDVSFRDVTVQLPGQPATHLRLWTDLGDTWMYMNGGMGQDGNYTFKHVPDRPTRLLLSAWDTANQQHWRHLGAAVVDVPAGDAPVVEYDFSQAAPLRLRATTPAEADDGLAFSVRLADEELPPRPANLVGLGELNDRYVDEDGFVTFKLAPGSYIVTATLDGDSQERRVELNQGAEQAVEFNFTPPAE